MRVPLTACDFRWDRGTTWTWQALGVVAAWLYILFLHSDNDGLWYVGDAPRHAANGVFWWDFLSSLPVRPQEFALGYYARYPVINPTAYPPAFYLLEGAAFRVFGLSPYVAKWLVSTFALLAGLYVMAWLRRWMSREAGWAAILLLLQPGVVTFTNAVMLNVPSMALAVAALYHFRRWLEAPVSRHIYAALLFTVVGILTYFQCGIVVFVILTWLAIDRRWTVMARRAGLVFMGVAVLVFTAAGIAAYVWAPTYVTRLLPHHWGLAVRYWTFYGMHLPMLADLSILTLALVGLAVSLSTSGRRDGLLTVLWALATYVALSSVMTRDIRYALLMLPPIIILSVRALWALARVASRCGGIAPSRVPLPALALLVALQATLAAFVQVPRVDGFRELVNFVETVSPDGRIFYQGLYNGVFSFYLRSGDTDRRRAVVLGSKVLYMREYDQFFNLVASRSDIVDFFRRKCGCQWIVVERRWQGQRIAALRFLREAVTGPEFRFVRSFPIVAQHESVVDVYEFVLPAQGPEALEIPFPKLGHGTVMRITPLGR